MALNRYALQRQKPLTQGAQIAEDQNTQGLQTGNFADVQSAAKATQRANAARSSQALQAARGTVARSGGDFSPQAAIRAQDLAFAGANAQNLDATNSVNQLQRQYRQDALNRADTYEQNAQTGAIGERNYQSNLDAADLAQKNQEVGFGFQSRQLDQTDKAMDNDMTRYNLSRGDQNRQFDVSTGLSQQQINNQASQFDKSLGQRDKEFGVQSAQTDRQLGQTDTAQANEMTRYNLSRGDTLAQNAVQNNQNQQQIDNQASQFGVTSGQNQQQINNQAAQFDKTFGLSERAQTEDTRRYDLTRGDTLAQTATQNNQWQQSFDANRQDAATQAGQFDKTLAQRQTEFGVTSAQSQQQIENQAAQAAAQLGYNYAALSQDDKQYFQTLAQRQSEFSTTTAQNQQQIDNQAAQAAAQLGYNYAALSQEDKQYFQTLAQRQTEFATTSAQTDRQLGQTDTAMQNEVDRYNLSRGDTLAQNAVQNAQQDRIIGLQETRLTADTSAEQYQKTMDAINSITDPKAKSAAISAYLRGEDVGQFISGTLYGSDGSLNKDYASASPAEQQYQAKMDELKSYYPDKTDAEIQQMALHERTQERAITQAPITKQVEQAQVDEAIKTANSGKTLTPEQNDVLANSGALKSFPDATGLITGFSEPGLYNVNGKVVEVLYDKWNSPGQTAAVKIDGKSYWLGYNQATGKSTWYEKTAEGSGSQVNAPI